MNVKSKGKGKTCPKEADAIEERACNTQACPLDCVGKWSTWTECTKQCGGGFQHRLFRVQKEAEVGGHCDYLDNEKQTRPCNEKTCLKDCVGAWANGVDARRD